MNTDRKILSLRFFILLLFLACIFIPKSYSQDESFNNQPLVYSASDFKLSIGEVPDWGNPALSSRDWPSFDDEIRKKEFADVYWISWNININGNSVQRRDLEYYISIVGSYEVYWDKALLYKSGIVSNSKSNEKPGQIQTAFLIPKEWVTPGMHEVTFKISSHHRKKGQQVFRHAYIKNYNLQSRHTSLGSLIPSLALSITLIIGIYFITLFASEKENYSHIIFSFLCFSLFAYGMLGEWPHLIGYTYNWHFFKEITVGVCGLLFSILLPLFFLFKHGLGSKWFVIFLMPVAAYSMVYFTNANMGNSLFWSIGFAFSILIMAFVVKKYSGHFWWELAGLTLCLLGVLVNWNDLENFFLIFPVLVFFILLSHVIQAQRDKYNGMVIKIKASQLEAQLLRRNIQPHFILNSLASIIELVETEPDQSVEFISALADEFRLFSDIANKPIIKLSQEIELCKNHLTIMGFRHQKKYELECEGIGISDEIPTGILHTLLENSFSHNDYSNDDISFKLKRKIEKGLVHLIFESPYKSQKTNKFDLLNTGTGTSFIESQLKQYCGEKWSVNGEKSQSNWVSTIIYQESS